MSAENSGIGTAIANLTESRYGEGGLVKKANEAGFNLLVALKEKEIEQAPVMEELKHKGQRKKLNVLIWALVVTATLAILANVYNHRQSVNLDKIRVEKGQHFE